MATTTKERRRSVRMAAAYQAVILNHRMREIARGRTANISESGVLVLVRSTGRFPDTGQVYAELTIPADPAAGTKRQVVYLCRIVRRQQLGGMMGLGLEFLEKTA